MAKHHTFFGKLFGWIGDIFHSANQSFLEIAVTITQAVKDALNSNLVDFLTKVIPGDVDDKIVAILREKVPILLADELMIQAAGVPATEEEAQALATKLLESFGGLKDDQKEEFYTKVAAKIYIFLQAHKNGERVTFGQAAALVESAYQSWLKSKEE